MKTNRIIRTAYLILLFTLSALVFSLSAGALGELPAPNDKPRHTVCDYLSDQAAEYYSGDHSYENLSALPGAEDISTSYAAAQNNALYNALSSLMTETNTYFTTYSGSKAGSLAYFWASTDAVESSQTYVMFYSDVLANTENAVLNREHIWPKSRASFSTAKTGGGSDLHHLRPAVDKINSAKSDHLFGNINGVYTDGVTVGTFNNNVCYYVKKDLDMFECKDDVKGDVARILLYVYCRWRQPNLYTDMTENLPEPDSDSKSNSGKKVIESLDTLLSWCEDDPVDTWEMRRNDLVQDVQGNRNVFIDYPELAWKMFGKDIPDDMTTPSRGEPEHPVIRLRGDADRDGEVTEIDATAIQRFVTGISLGFEIDEDVADVNGDGLDITDATLIQRFLIKLPVPFNIGEPI